MKTNTALVLLAGALISQASPLPATSYQYVLQTVCAVPGESCTVVRRITEEITSIFDLSSAVWSGGPCSIPGQPCDTARNALFEIGSVAENALNALLSSEKLPRYSVLGDHSGSPSLAKREDALPHLGVTWTLCGTLHMNCDRDVESASTTPVRRSPDDLKRLVLGPEKREKREKLGFAWTRCGAFHMNCDRDVKSAVATLEDRNPDVLKRACFEAGGECARLVQARDAVQQIKREAESVMAKSLEEKRDACTNGGCAAKATDYLEARADGDEMAKRAEEACWAEDGVCARAARSIDSIEAALEAATSAF